MLFALVEKHAAVKAALSQLRKIPIAFEPFCSRIIFYNQLSKT
jgi:hypothetical protein